MKKVSFLFLLTALLSLAFTNPVADAVVTVDLSSSYIKWTGYKVTGKHYGKVMLKNGKLDFDANNMLTGGSFDINMQSITVEDLTGGSAEKLTGHLKSEDFFGVAKYPTAKFVITKVVSRGTPGAYKIIGNLTIKETTKEIRFNADVKEDGDKAIATGAITIDRSEYNIRYGSGSFFENLGDKTIYDDFDLEINLVVNK